MKRTLSRGFTLIELMVVVSIISVLSSVVLSGTLSARNRASDIQAESDLRLLRQGLEAYHLQNGHYPDLATPNADTRAGHNWDQLQSALAPFINLPWPNFQSSTWTLPDGATSLQYGYYYGHVPESGYLGGKFKIFDRGNNIYLSCLELYPDSYYLYANVPSGEDSFSQSDGGYDPDAIDPYTSLFGKVVNMPLSNCNDMTTFP